MARPDPGHPRGCPLPSALVRPGLTLVRPGLTLVTPGLTLLALGLTLLMLGLALLGPALASAAGRPGTRLVRFHGLALTVPRGWPVIRLDRAPSTCVRFDRHAVYLGTPAGLQRCPAHLAGRTEAILVSPLRPGAAAPALAADGALRMDEPRQGVVVTAAWGRRPGTILTALGLRRLPRTSPPAPAVAAVPPAGGGGRTARAADASGGASSGTSGSGPGAPYTGEGFDTCSTPSTQQMSAWSASPYHAVAVYIGGRNMACSQTNLTSAWVAQESSSGWRIVPVYVGLQAPGNSCGCAATSAATAQSDGAAAAHDAITEAQSLGLGAGNPIYYDMEAYPSGGSTTQTVLAFLAAWTSTLHGQGYLSGVYSSSDSGIADLSAQQGSGYAEPDDIWIANWNGQQNTTDANVPPSYWASHQRLHQYQGDHQETYGGTTMDIDGDYLDGATAAPSAASLVRLSVTPAADGTIDAYPRWSGPGSPVSWQLLGGPAPGALAPVGGAVSAARPLPIVAHSAYAFYAMEALDGSGQPLGQSDPVATPPHVAAFGASAYVSASGVGAVPVACFGSGACSLRMILTVGSRTLAATGSESFGPAGGLAHFKLTSLGWLMLGGAPHHRLAVRVRLQGPGGESATRVVQLVRFLSRGSGPARAASSTPSLRVLGLTAFVSGGWTGGLLVSCTANVPCREMMELSAAGRTVAATGPEQIGANQVGYLYFTLTPTGHRLLIRSAANQLPASVQVRPYGGGSTSLATLALSAF